MALLDLVLPRRCAVCGRVGTSLCAICLARLVRCAPPWCERCGAPGTWPVKRCAECDGRRLSFASARAALVYDAGARAFVASWKERGRRDLAAVAAELVVSGLPRPDAGVLTFVPGDPDRQLRPGPSETGCRRPHLRPGRSRSRAPPRSCTGGGARSRARHCVVAADREAPSA